jgi:hypothetical protein
LPFKDLNFSVSPLENEEKICHEDEKEYEDENLIVLHEGHGKHIKGEFLLYLSSRKLN